MNNKNKRELLLNILRQNVIKEEIGEEENKSPVSSYSNIEQDELMVFAEQFVKNKGRFIYCENEKDFINKLQNLIQYRKWDNILSFSENLHSYLKHSGVETVLENENAIVGISLCQAMIANTGSLLLTSAQGFGSRVNKLPSIFIILAHSSQVYPNYKEALQPILNAVPQNITTIMPSEALQQSVVEFYLYVIEQ